MATEAKQPVEHPVDSQNQPDQESHTVLALEGMTCASCAMRIEKGLKKLPGVKDANVNLATEQATVTYNPEQVGIEQMVQKVDTTGYKATPLVPPTPPVGADLSQPTADLSAKRPTANVPDITIAGVQEDAQTKRRQAKITRKRNLLI